MCPIGIAMGNPIAWPLFFVGAFFSLAQLSACSGKFAVGQRAGGAVSVCERSVESLSSYIRRFIDTDRKSVV